jgi:hypothetical protein
VNALSLGRLVASHPDDCPTAVQEAAPDPATVGVARDRAAWLLKIRRERETSFPQVQFADASWDILLDLFVRRTEGRLTSVSSACIGSGAPTTTALRHVTSLVNAGILSRWDSGADGRVGYVDLSDAVYVRLASLLARGTI